MRLSHIRWEAAYSIYLSPSNQMVTHQANLNVIEFARWLAEYWLPDCFQGEKQSLLFLRNCFPLIRFPVKCHSKDSLFSWLSLWFLMKHLEIPSIDFPGHSERTHHCTWVSHSPHLQPFPAIKPFWTTIEFPVYLKEGPTSVVLPEPLVDWSQGELKPAFPISSWEKQWKHMGKKQWPIWKHMENTWFPVT